jgi:uncharacterized protein YndB with AHSA1/START domain
MTETRTDAAIDTRFIATDAIEKEIVVHAPRAKVWRAIADSREFGKWFGAEMQEPFVAGQCAHGRITYPGYEHLTLEMQVERIEPERLFSFRWHPYAIDPQVDYSAEPTTRVVFELEEIAAGTRIKVTESGFDQIPLARRAEAFRMNAQGWAEQVRNIARHVEPTR